MLAASWSESVGEPQKVLFINLIEDRSHGVKMVEEEIRESEQPG
jgi:hypothetical protein